MPSSGILRRVPLVRTNVPPKRPFLQEPHGVTSQKTTFFIDGDDCGVIGWRIEVLRRNMPQCRFGYLMSHMT
jgi:hypothetical protein